MTTAQHWARLKKDPKDALYYVQGVFRWYLCQSRFYRLVRHHVREQFVWRLNGPANACFRAGECRCCGCRTPELFLADKGCSVLKFPQCALVGLIAPCYPALMNARQWRQYKETHGITIDLNKPV